MRISRLGLLFCLTLFVSAGLLFLLQPLIARRILPLLGGAPAVWNTCMLFFQAGLLAGYAYAHWLPRGLAAVQLMLLAAAALLLPPGLPLGWSPPDHGTPVFWLLACLVVGVGLPFAAVAASAPLLQRWFARTGADPYFLYAASNLGSMLALIAYPVVVEPNLTLDEQATAWAVGYALLGILTALCAMATRQRQPLEVAGESPPLQSSPPPLADRAWWLLFAFLPSSLLLSVTTYVTTDIAAIPLLWIAPLALYLLTFTLTFATRPPLPQRWMLRVLPMALVIVAVPILAEMTDPLPLMLAVHLTAFFIVAMACHGELARRRPAPERLTGFYLWLSLGGMLGGVFNGLVAPLVFPGLAEYPLVLVLVAIIVPATRTPTTLTVRDLLWPLGLGGLAAGLILVAQHLGLRSGPLALGLLFAFPAVLCFAMHERPMRFGLGLAALFLAGTLYQGIHGRVIYRERSFFGVHRVTATGDDHVLIHGNTVHGLQRFGADQSRWPRLYYHRSGPAGFVFQKLHENGDARPVAVVGLGAGSLAAYGQSGQEFTFFEIDPTVIHIAKDPKLFTFLADSPANITVIPGDARLTLARAPAKHYGLIVIDAFGSDAIPIHLLTREALQIYRSKLKDDGLLLFHVSNRYLDLAPVLGDLAGDAGLVCRFRDDLSSTEKFDAKWASQWVALAATAERATLSNMWEKITARPGVRVWSDDYCDLVGALRKP